MAGCRDCWVKTRGDYSDLEFCADCEHMGPHFTWTAEQDAMAEAEDQYERGLMSEEEYNRIADWYDEWARS